MYQRQLSKPLSLVGVICKSHRECLNKYSWIFYMIYAIISLLVFWQFVISFFSVAMTSLITTNTRQLLCLIAGVWNL